MHARGDLQRRHCNSRPYNVYNIMSVCVHVGPICLYAAILCVLCTYVHVCMFERVICCFIVLSIACACMSFTVLQADHN